MNLVLIELNELNFDYIKKYFEKFKIKNLEKIYNNIIETESENSYELLEPWIQWQSIHTGKTAKEHGVFRLGDATNSNHKQIFNQIEKLGFKVGSISAMNSINDLENPSYFIPDPWTSTKSDKKFFSRLITKVLKDTVNNNASQSFSKINYIYLILIFFKFVRVKKYFLFFQYGFQTIFKRWKKALFLDLLINEIHLFYMQKEKPNFSCVFFNAGAHIQHHYLLNSLANNTNIKNPEWLIKKEDDPFMDSLLIYDEILGNYLDKNINLVVATGLTQKIVEKPEYYYRLIDHENFLKKIKINFTNVLPRMSRDFLIDFDSDNERNEAYSILKEIKLNNQNLFGILDLRKKSIFVTLTYNKEIKPTDKIIINKDELEIYKDVVFVALKNGSHDGKGFLYSQGKISKFFDNLKKIKIFQIKDIINEFFKNK